VVGFPEPAGIVNFGTPLAEDPMADQTPLSRALRLLRLLGGGHWQSLARLRDLLGTRDSVRTIERSLAAIEEAGILLERRKVAHGALEVRLPAALRVPPHLLSTDEALAALILAQFRVHFAGSPMGGVVDGLLDKVDQLLPRHGLFAQADLEELGEAFQVRQPGHVPLGEDTGLLLRLLEAILERRCCTVDYQRLDAAASRFAIQPHALVIHQGALYVLAWQPHHGSWLHLALHRVDGLTVEEERFTRQESFQLTDFLNGAFGIWSAPPQTVVLDFGAQVRGFVRERQWHPSQTLEERPDGGLRLTLRVGISPELRAWVLRWGSHVVVAEPVALREEVLRELRQAAARYDGQCADPTIS
jgi:predicted DNA-binding transcriptional regulator YafY